ncbi:zinc ABC transporter substrate-binding protein [Pseudaestuariivita atlantica]|uniref:High-affinity zinc uptake system protein ZnuA n=1 Tax=Pseudaestuariivita atlantica TaxID=1317121 RepID=A0A0L1JS38_9RHOB|nr:zinc ABC transporter substrate-binding protein [Pseudaestuariivita atlantica]KNG94223.1 hypothetical protein ATO11_08350 [Pseudaestuariivita atlantica]
MKGTAVTLGALLVAFGSPAMAEAPRVATDILPVHGLVAAVMDGVGTPGLVIGPGEDPHGHQMRPSQAANLARADLVVWVGSGLSPAFEKAAEALAGDAVSLSLSGVPGVELLEFRSSHGHDEDDHADEDPHDENDHGEDDNDMHAEGDADPHAWLDPDNAVLWSAAIAEALAGLDPANADRYRANAREVQAKIEAASTALGERIAGLGDVEIVAYHDAYQYLEVHYDFEIDSSLIDAAGADPGARGIAEVSARMQGETPVCVLAEPGFRIGLIDTALGAVPYTIVELDPLGAHIPQGPGFYPSLLRDFADRLGACGG